VIGAQKPDFGSHGVAVLGHLAYQEILEGPGLIPPQLPGSPTYLRPGTLALAWFLRDLGYNTGGLARIIWATTFWSGPR